MGFDGTSGDQPRGTTIAFNLVHELGIWEKQVCVCMLPMLLYVRAFYLALLIAYFIADSYLPLAERPVLDAQSSFYFQAKSCQNNIVGNMYVLRCCWPCCPAVLFLFVLIVCRMHARINHGASHCPHCRVVTSCLIAVSSMAPALALTSMVRSYACFTVCAPLVACFVLFSFI